MKLHQLTGKIKRRLQNLWIDLTRQRVIVLGDSHTKVFNYINEEYELNQFFDVVLVGGATAMGMVNPNSKTDCLNRFRTRMSLAKIHQPVIMLLGEVDTGFVIWFRAQTKGLSIESQFERSLVNYFSFVDELQKRGFQTICLMAAPLPTIKDNSAEFGEIANLRNEVKATLSERTELTLAYNRRIREYCDTRGLLFLDLDDQLLGEDGVISSVFLNQDPLDHHCDHDVYSKIIVAGLRRLGIVS